MAVAPLLAAAAAAPTGWTTRSPVRQKGTQRNSTDVRSGKTLPISSEVRLLQSTSLDSSMGPRKAEQEEKPFLASVLFATTWQGNKKPSEQC